MYLPLTDVLVFRLEQQERERQERERQERERQERERLERERQAAAGQETPGLSRSCNVNKTDPYMQAEINESNLVSPFP